MENSTHHAGSATGIDLAALEQLARAATPGPWHWVNPENDQPRQPGEWRASLRTVDEFPATSGHWALPKFIVDADEICDGNMDANAAFIAAANPATVLSLIALARATPQHPDLAEQVRALAAKWNADAIKTGFAGSEPAFELLELLDATPQHSVTEQDERQIAMTVDDAMRIVKANWGDMGAIENAFAANRAQPLASTAATQPEQADELSIADRIREVQANMEGEASLQVLCALDDELNEARAALAIPASASTKLLVDAAMGVVNKWVMLAGYDEEETQRFCDQLQAAFGSIPASTAASEQLPVCAPNCFYGDCPPCVAAGLRPAAASEQQAGADERALVRDAVSQALTGVYYCGRVWSAWNVGTMDESDFTPAAEVDEVLDEITDRAMAAITHRDTPATATASASVNCPWEKPFD